MEIRINLFWTARWTGTECLTLSRWASAEFTTGYFTVVYNSSVIVTLQIKISHKNMWKNIIRNVIRRLNQGFSAFLMVSALHYVYMSGPVVVRSPTETSLKHLTWLQKYLVTLHGNPPFLFALVCWKCLVYIYINTIIILKSIFYFFAVISWSPSKHKVFSSHSSSRWSPSWRRQTQCNSEGVLVKTILFNCSVSLL